MPYARLDVFWPEGLIKTFFIAEPNVSVGRSSGNLVMLDNTTISRYHFSITLDKGQVYITDLESANGTFLDGVKLPSNERRILGDSEEILIGNLRIIYHRLDESPTQSSPALDDTTQRIALSLPEFRIDLQGPDQGVAPGAHISAELSIANTSGQDQRYNVDISGLPKDWIRIDRPTPFIEAEDTTFVLINFRPLRKPESQPGDYPITVRVYPQEKPEAVLETTLLLQVLPFSGFGVDLESSHIRGGERLQLHLHNQGSANLPLSIDAVDKTGALSFNILAPFVMLNPGQRLSVQGEVKVKRPTLFGAQRQHPFDVTIRANNHAGFVVATRAYFLDKPLLPGWSLALLVAALSLFVLAVIGGLALLVTRPAPQPRFAAFAINSTQIERGSPLEINWQATDVAELSLSLNGTPVLTATNDPQNTSFIVDTSQLSGQIDVLLEGSNGERSDSRSVTVNIYQPVVVERFAVTPEQIVRYVAQSLNIDWNVPGAVFTRVTGLEAFSTRALEIEGPSGSFEGIPVLLQEPLTITLQAQDEAGNITAQTFVINVVNPECRTAGASAVVRTGPDPGHQVVSTITEDVVVVNAQDLSGQWLRVIGLTGGLSGWTRRSELVCNDNFDAGALLKEVNVPPPPPTITPEPTATPPLTPTTAG